MSNTPWMTDSTIPYMCSRDDTDGWLSDISAEFLAEKEGITDIFIDDISACGSLTIIDIKRWVVDSPRNEQLLFTFDDGEQWLMGTPEGAEIIEGQGGWQALIGQRVLRIGEVFCRRVARTEPRKDDYEEHSIYVFRLATHDVKIRWMNWGDRYYTTPVSFDLVSEPQND